jgi:hypothetical protein
VKKIKLNRQIIKEWAEQGYNEKVREYTKSIQFDTEAVQKFQELAGAWFADYDWGEEPPFKSNVDQICRSLDAMSDFLGELFDSIITITLTQPQITVEIAWSQPDVGLVLWDRFTTECDDPVILSTLFCYFSIVDYRLAPPIERRLYSPMHRFHPERYRSTRKFARTFAKIYKQNSDFETGGVTEGALQHSVGLLISEVNERRLKYPRRYKNDDVSLSQVINSELILALAYARFSLAGRQIMDFPPGLSEMLSHTNICDIPVAEIRLPYVSQFLHFGPQQHLEIEPGWLVDGAYVETRGGPGEVKIIVTAKAPDEDVADLWYLRPEPSYSQSFSSKHSEVDLAAALEEVLSERLAYLFRKEASAEEGSVMRQAKKQLAEEGLGDIARGVTDVSGQSAKAEIDQVNRRYPVFLEALKLIINAILYITAYPEDIETTWSEKAPYDLRTKAIHGNPKEMNKARSKLEELGYSAVHLCGKSIQLQNPKIQKPSHGEGHKSLHWRRGHWRNQAYGEGRTQHRLRWIMPMLIGGKDFPGDDPDLGHVYLVT